jgi:hypothetical protein
MGNSREGVPPVDRNGERILTPTLAETIRRLEPLAETVFCHQSELSGEIALLFKGAIGDPTMALARARRLIEVLLKDRYIRRECPPPPYGNEVKCRGWPRPFATRCAWRATA